MRDFLIFFLTCILVFQNSNALSRFSRRQILAKPILSSHQLLKINPLAIHLALKLHPKKKGIWKSNLVIFAKNIKDFIFNVYRGYLLNLLKFKIDPNKIFDRNSKKDVVVKHSLKEITCNNPNAYLANSFDIFSMLYQEIYFMDQNNYLKKPDNLVKKILKLILSVGHNCKDMLEYYKYFNSEIKKNFKYLVKINQFVQRNILIKLAIEKDHFLHAWGNFEKMGLFVGHIFSIFRMFKPKDEEKYKITQLIKLYNALNDEKKRNKMEKILEKKYKRLMGEDVD